MGWVKGSATHATVAEVVQVPSRPVNMGQRRWPPDLTRVCPR